MRDKILQEIYTSQIIEKVSSRYWSYIKGNREDFIQYIYLILCELPEKKLVHLYQNNQINFYIISIIKNQATCDYNPFHRLYDDPRMVYDSNKIERDESLETI